jgi:poly(beta-D-mannuronate) lyase
MRSGVFLCLRLFVLAAALAVLPAAVRGARYDVYTTADFTGLPTLAAGDTVVVHAGTYSNVGNKTITGNGTANNPILIYAENPGTAVFAGSTRIVLSGTRITFAGFKFDGQTVAGGMPPAEKWGIVQTAANSADCRITNCMFRDFNAGAITGNTYYWLVIQGYRHTVDYNSFEGKTTIGASVVLATPESDKTTPRSHLFAGNYFGPRTVIGSNGYEGIRVGDSAHQGWNMASIFQFNYFYRAIYGAGEPELISNKSANNTYRYNTFVENRGQLTLRHGDNGLVEGNFFFGAGLADSGGVRVIGQNHTVRNNYFQDIAGSGVTSTIVVQKGDPTWPGSDDASTYEAAHNAKIFHNTFLNCAQPFFLGRNSSGTGAIDPTGVQVRNNVVQSSSGAGAVFDIDYSTAAIAFSGNYVYHPDSNYGVTGLSGVTYGPGSPGLVQDSSLGYAIPSSSSPVLGLAGGTTPATTLDIRALTRPASGKDTGCHEREVTGSGVGPLVRDDVGPEFYGGPADTFIPPGGSTAAPVFSPAAGTYTSGQSVTISSATSGATIRYTTNGTNPTSASGTVYSGPVSIAATTTLKAIAYKSGLTDSAVSTANYTIMPAGGTTITSSAGFVGVALSAVQSGSFTAEFDVSPSISPANMVAGLSSGSATGYSGIACMVRFNPGGTIDARNGGAYTTGTIPYTANTVYHIRLVVNVPAHTYSAYVTAAGGSEQTIGTNLAFRTEQAAVTSLSHAAFNVNATPGGSLTRWPVTVTGSAAKFTIPGGSVTASLHDGNVPANTVDGSLSTRWSAQGDPQWIRYDLGSVKTPAWVRLAFLNGDTRVYTFDVQLSSDGSNWTTVHSGASSGTTTALETYNFPNAAARYVRIVGHGNSVNTWNSITETEVWGY